MTPTPSPAPIQPITGWRSMIGGNEIQTNRDGLSVRRHDRVVHIRARSIAAGLKAKRLAEQDIRELHYIGVKSDPADPLSAATIWLDGEGNMIKIKGCRKPAGAVARILTVAKLAAGVAA